ncbi:hypothetical protein HY522_00545 [bacterium]|nr:hypothetical protein [bacterium]
MFYGRGVTAILMAFALMLFGGRIALAGEHPTEHPTEHPSGGKKAEHPEHPAKTGKAEKSVGLTKEDMAEAISGYVAKDADLKGGYFLVFDKDAGKPLALKLEKVHKDRLSRVAKDVYFACADFRTHDGKKVYDLDVFMHGSNKKHLKVTEVSVHKEDGDARYGWVEKDGVWSKSPIKGKKAPEKKEWKGSDHEGEHSGEHPQEHPKGK